MVGAQCRVRVLGMERWLDGKEGGHIVLKNVAWVAISVQAVEGAPSALASASGPVGKGSKNVGSPPIHMIKYFDRAEVCEGIRSLKAPAIFIRKPSRITSP